MQLYSRLVLCPQCQAKATATFVFDTIRGRLMLDNNFTTVDCPNHCKLTRPQLDTMARLVA